MSAEDEAGGMRRGGALGLEGAGVAAGLLGLGKDCVAFRKGLLDCAGAGAGAACRDVEMGGEGVGC